MRGGKIFISYRREDGRGDSGRLYDRLKSSFPGRVFLDVETIPPGVAWDEHIAQFLSQSGACIVVIGRNWLNAVDESGRRRLDDPNDFVRQEIAAALKRDMRVVPVLVGGARMPTEQELPADLRDLCRRNAIPLPEAYWNVGVEKLIVELETAFAAPRPEPKVAPPPVRPSPPPPQRSNRTWTIVGAAALVVAAVVVVIMLIGRSNKPAAPPFQFAGHWRAVAMGPAGRTDEDLFVYPDQSLRWVAQSSTLAVGKWQDNTAADSLEATDAVDLKKNVKFSCTWKNVSESHESLNGTCLDSVRNAWTLSLSRAPGNPIVPPYNIQHVDLTTLNTAERAAFTEYLASQPCHCGMNVLTCLRTHYPRCTYGPGLAQEALANFLRTVRS
jgi:TIR domain